MRHLRRMKQSALRKRRSNPAERRHRPTRPGPAPARNLTGRRAEPPSTQHTNNDRNRPTRPRPKPRAAPYRAARTRKTMKKTPIGHVRCPVCDHADAEVKTDKNYHAYIHCTDCNAQTFTRNDYRDGHLRKRMRPSAAPDATVTVTVTDTEPKPKPKPGPAATVPPATVPTAPKTVLAKAAWFTPILGSA